MKIVVCMFRSQAGDKVDIDPETRCYETFVRRDKNDPYDLFALGGSQFKKKQVERLPYYYIGIPSGQRK